MIRKLEISRFRGIESLCWLPMPGVNALVGPGDASKSTILDAIDWCMGLRRSVTVCESDFHRMDITRPIRITATIGQLSPELMSLSRFGECLRGFAEGSTDLQPEPHADCEDVIQLVFKVESDLEPQWFVLKHDDDDDDVVRLTWSQRKLLAPIRIGAAANYHLSWRRDSALSKLTEGTVSASTILATALHTARETFAANPPSEVNTGLELAKNCCTQFGISDISKVIAGLDVDVVSTGDNCVALHDQDGVPLRRLGTGSSRLLSSALVTATGDHPILLLDELEHGLEPHRIIRLLQAIGSKDKVPKQQVFTTTHSPVAVSELSVSQLWIVRHRDNKVCLQQPANELQGTVRTYPNALLASKILVCEGASEIGIVRGMDNYLRMQTGEHRFSGGLLLHGLAIVDGRGSSTAANALALAKLGYPTALLRDSDVEKKKPKEKQKWDASIKAEIDFIEAGGKVFCWEHGFHTEAVVFQFATDENVKAMIAYAEEEHGVETIDQDVRNFGSGVTLGDIKGAWQRGVIEQGHRNLLGLCSNKRSWFKRIDRYEHITCEIIFPSLKENALYDQYLRKFLIRLAEWCVQ